MLSNDAVSQVNGKANVFAGNFDGENGWSGEGSVSWPIAQHYGAQLDVLHTKVDDVEFSGIGAHLFWRDNTKGLVGLSVGGIDGDLQHSIEIAAEGEYYLHQITLAGKLGHASIKYDAPAPFIDTDKGGLLTQASVGWYPMNNLNVAASAERRFNQNAYSLEAEFQLPDSNVSLLVNLMEGAHDYDHAWFGVRYYFGERKSLKTRHRHDDPKSLLTGTLAGIGHYGAAYNKKARAYYAEAFVPTFGSEFTLAPTPDLPPLEVFTPSFGSEFTISPPITPIPLEEAAAF